MDIWDIAAFGVLGWFTLFASGFGSYIEGETSPNADVQTLT